MKEPAVLQKESRLNPTGPEPSRGGERTTVTSRGKKVREQTQQAGLSTKGEREGREGRGGLGTERNRGRERERGRGRRRVREAERSKDTKVVT